MEGNAARVRQRGSDSGIGGKLITVVSINRDGEAQSADAASDVLTFAGGVPPPPVRQACLTLAPLQKTTVYFRRDVTHFLRFAEAIRLMRVSRDMHALVKNDPVLRLDAWLGEISPRFDELVVDGVQITTLQRRFQSVEADIAQLRVHGALPATADATPGEAVANVTSTRPRFKLANFIVPKPSQPPERPGQAQLRQKEAARAQLATKLQAFEPAIESLVFHFVSQRSEGPWPVKAADTTRQETSPARTAVGVCTAMNAGAVELVRTGVDEFLILPERLMPHTRKLAWLEQIFAVMEAFGQSACDTLKLPEQRRYEAVAACIGVIVRSRALDPSEKLQFCARLGDLFRLAVRNDNYALAACILLGIDEPSADPHLRKSLLAVIADQWRGLANCVDFVSEVLGRLHYRAPEWVHEVNARLRSMKPALPTPVPTQV